MSPGLLLLVWRLVKVQAIALETSRLLKVLQLVLAGLLRALLTIDDCLLKVHRRGPDLLVLGGRRQLIF